MLSSKESSKRLGAVALAVVFFLGLAANASFAEDKDASRQSGKGQVQVPSREAQDVEAMLERLSEMRKRLLKGQLALSEKKAASLSRLLKGYDNERLKLQGDYVEVMRLMGEAARSELSDEAASKHLEKYNDVINKLYELRGRHFKEVRKLLTPSEMVRYMAIEQMLQRQLQMNLRGADRPSGKGGPGGR